MVVSPIYKGTNIVTQIYHRGKIIYHREPLVFHEVDNGNLIILGVITANSTLDGLYLDCEPDVSDLDWIYPVQNGNVLRIEQVYSAVQNGNVLEVE